MDYTSTRNNKKNFSFKDVFLQGLADDWGLFVPSSIDPLSKEKLNLMPDQMADNIIKKFKLNNQN